MNLPPRRSFTIDSKSGLIDRATHDELDEEIATQIIRMSHIIHQKHGDGIWQSIQDMFYVPFLMAVRNENLSGIIQQMSNFFREPISTGLVSHTTFDKVIGDPGGWDRTQRIIIRDLETWMLMTDHVYEFEPLRCTLAGNPFGLVIEPGILIAPDTCRHHYHASVVGRWLGKIRRGNARLVVLEIGGGFGGFAYYLLREERDYPLTYINIDLEVPLYIMLYYLMRSLPGPQVTAIFNTGITTNDINSNDILLVHADSVDKIDVPVNIIYNSNSLSEMPEPDIVRYFNLIDRCHPQIIFQQNSNIPVDEENIKTFGRNEFPASMFPYPEGYVEVYRARSPWASEAGFYYEFLHMREDCLNL